MLLIYYLTRCHAQFYGGREGQNARVRVALLGHRKIVRGNKVKLFYVNSFN